MTTVGIGIALDDRWSAARLILQSQGFSIAPILVAVARAWNDFAPAKARTWVFVGGLVPMLAGIVALYIVLEARRRRQAPGQRGLPGGYGTPPKAS